ncbi:hypothetical protein C8Q69DRAFT_171755 [Paecilomyces variotii]|uniref:Uncharacterized protein n=1 Tax=Byssochlamys spectabilis TaxID=264951 RepID=A0A443I300_BYSSP|nr:hypothetical protein C8Q69DRAFT_171755 [Paecilomyces variotii]RWQ98437.1 hypothetical protein C8Q69DRAFT_171755 [Paecilomyces variotii]
MLSFLIICRWRFCVCDFIDRGGARVSPGVSYIFLFTFIPQRPVYRSPASRLVTSVSCASHSFLFFLFFFASYPQCVFRSLYPFAVYRARRGKLLHWRSFASTEVAHFRWPVSFIPSFCVVSIYCIHFPVHSFTPSPLYY